MTGFQKAQAPPVNGMQTVRGLFRHVAAALLLIFLQGCAEKNFIELRSGIETRGHYINGVPFREQKNFDCGPAALAGVFAFWGKTVEMDRVTAAIYMPQLKGTLPMDMERFARESGFKTDSSAGTLDRLKEFIRRGIPIICLIDTGFGPYRQPHYITAIGFDDTNAVVIMHDGSQENRLMSYDAFERAWARAGRWMIGIEPVRERK